MNEQSPLPYAVAVAGEARCILTTAQLLLARRIHLPHRHVGESVKFADGTSARVYRETIVEGIGPKEPCALVVEFKLRLVRGWGHDVFRAESLLNTPLFVGFPGFVSKLWLTNDERGYYRGIYEWDGPALAENYARSLWRVLKIGCEPASIHYIVLPDVRRDELVSAVVPAGTVSEGAGSPWWRPISPT